MRLFGFLEGLVIVARNRIVQVRIHVSALREDDHQREALLALRTERAEAFDIGDCHTASGYHSAKSLSENS